MDISIDQTGLLRLLTMRLLIPLLLLFFAFSEVVARERCEVRYTATGYGAAAGLSAESRQSSAKKRGIREAYRDLTYQVGLFRLKQELTVASAVKRNQSFRRQINQKIREATVLGEGFDEKERYKIELELCIVFPMAADGSTCAAPGTLCGKQQEEESEKEQEGENFLTRLTHKLTEPVLNPEKNPEADFDRYSSVLAEDRLLPVQDLDEPGHTLIRDGVDMTLVEAVKKDQKNAPALFRMAVLGGTDREVALASVLMGMVNPTPDELSNVINQAITLGVTRGEVDRAVNRVKQACEVCKELENPAEQPIAEIESGPVE